MWYLKQGMKKTKNFYNKSFSFFFLPNKRRRKTKTKRQRDKETKRERDKETKRQRDKETKRQRDKETLLWKFLQKCLPVKF
jgi:hypothetical protein